MPPPPFESAGVRVPTGARGYATLPVVRTPGGEPGPPRPSCTGGDAGPILTLLAAVHGDEIIPVGNLPGLPGRLRAGGPAPDRARHPRGQPPGPRGVSPRGPGAARRHRPASRLPRKSTRLPHAREESLRLCCLLGTGLIHENVLPPGTAAGCANARGIPAASVELGGPSLSAGMTAGFTAIMLRRLHNVLHGLGMEAGGSDLPAERWYSTRSEGAEANPGVGGSVLSRADAFEDLGRSVVRAEPPGTVLDPYTCAVLEELTAPCDGLACFGRMSGLLEAGTKGFAVADRAGLRHLP